MDENQTTQAIKNAFGANYTISEVRTALAEAKAKSTKQAPYFDGRLLDRIAKMEKALEESGVPA